MTQYVAQTAFSRGWLTKRVHDRPELDHYKLGLAFAENWIVLRHGNLRRRPPTEFIAEIKDSSKEARLIPFTFNTEQSYILEMSDSNMRVYKDAGVVLDGGVPVDVAMPYGTTDMLELDHAQSNDVLYVMHKGFYPRRLTRTSHVDWQLNNISFVDGPWGPKNGSGTKITPSANIIANASTTMTFDYTAGVNDGDGLSATDVGRYLRYEHPGDGNGASAPTTGQHVAWGQITAVSSDKVCTVLWLGTAGIETLSGVTLVNNTYASEHWWLGDFYTSGSYPHRCVFWSSRLHMARSDKKPKSIWSSTSGGYEIFTPSDRDGVVAEDHAFLSTVAGDAGIQILWLVDAKVMQFATESTARVYQSTDGGLVAPDNRKQDKESADGAADIQPIQIGSVTLYVEKGGRAVREMAYSFQQDAYVTPDASILSEHLLKAGVKSWAYAQTPNSMAWAAMNDGSLVTLTYERSQQTVGWAAHDVGGFVESIATIPGDSNTEVWLIVRREINGSTVRYIERLLDPFDEDLHTLEDYAHLDCQARYEGSATDVVTGLGHLEGELVGVVADGIYIGTTTVLSGKITLPLDRSAEKIAVGKLYSSRFTTLKPPIQSRDGSTLGRNRKATAVGLSFMETVDIKIGSAALPDSTFKELFSSPQVDQVATVPELQTGFETISIDDSWETGQGQITGLVDTPYPSTVRAIEVELEFNP